MIDQIKDIAIQYAPKVAGAIITLIIGFIIIGWITNSAKKAMNKSGIDNSIRPFLGSLINVGLKILLLLSVATMFGIETTSFVAIFGAMAFAIGMALQGSLGHFASGVLILVFKPYRVGDKVEIANGNIGKVDEIQVFNTVLKTLDNKRIIVPNGIVTNNVIINISGQGTIGVEITFGIGYPADIDRAKKIILEVGSSCPYILDSPAQEVVVSALADSSVNLFTRLFCKSEDYRNTFFFMQESVKKAFDKAGIGIPYPQLDVHMISN